MELKKDVDFRQNFQQFAGHRVVFGFQSASAASCSDPLEWYLFSYHGPRYKRQLAFSAEEFGLWNKLLPFRGIFFPELNTM